MSRVQVPSLTPEAQAPDQREHRKVRGFCVVGGVPAGARGRDLPGALLLRSAGPPPQTRGRAPRPHPPTDQQGGHPRVCGAERYHYGHFFHQRGPSPRLRGRGPVDRSESLPARSIPASAGTSCGGRKVGIDIVVHPRVCGDEVSWSCDTTREDGPSPRLRGRDLLTCAFFAARTHFHSVAKTSQSCAQ